MDLVPPDLEAHFEHGDYTLMFDWRTYLSTFFDELRLLEDLHRLGTVSTHRGERLPLAQEDMDGQLEVAKTIELTEANQRLRNEVRMRRRIKIGLKSNFHVDTWAGTCVSLVKADLGCRQSYGRLQEDAVGKMRTALECQKRFNAQIHSFTAIPEADARKEEYVPESFYGDSDTDEEHYPGDSDAEEGNEDLDAVEEEHNNDSHTAEEDYDESTEPEIEGFGI